MAEVLTRDQAPGVRGQDVAAFLADSAARPFAWGRADCCTLAADWAVERGRYDPAREWRGSYRSALGARRLLRRTGGLLPLAREAMAGFPEIDPEDARDGDVGVVEGALERRKGRPWVSQAAAIRLGGMWIVRTPKGLIGNRPPLIAPLAAWRIA